MLGAVAQDAKVSKGGLLYHFRTKDALVAGLTQRMLDRFDEAQDQIAAQDAERPGAWTRAYLASTVDADGAPADNSAQLMAGILAALGRDSAELERVRERFSHWHRRLQSDGLDATTAAVVRLAADGLWLSALLGLPRPDEESSVLVLEALREMTRARP